jgi:hypothetical protein
MAAFLQNFLGGSKPSASPAPADDAGMSPDLFHGPV